MHLVRTLLGILLSFFVVEVLIFHTNLYPSIVKTSSTTGYLETFLHNERRRIVTDRNQILSIGDSRMGFLPRYVNEPNFGTGYTFATIATPGTTPRCWYYMLRDIDPTRRRYAAIVIAVDDYEDAETWENYANRASDLHYLIARLHWSDLIEFSRSYEDPSAAMQAARGILLKGLVYKADFQDFLLDPVARLKEVRLSRRESRHWFYDYVGTPNNVKSITIDWEARQVNGPPNFDPALKAEFKLRFLDPRSPEHGQHSAYLKHWFGKIYDLYRGSGTRIVFIRLPRGPFIRPDQPALNPHSSVRELAARPEVIMSPEHFFAPLEDPQLFMDPYHMNGPGCAEFSRLLARHLRQLLGAPAG
jgi:hypothetical protein